MAYKQIDERFWKDTKVKKLSKDGYLFFLYLLTSPHTHFTGLSEMPLEYVNIDTPLKEKESKAALTELRNLGIVDYDQENSIILIVNMHKYQVKSHKQRIGAEYHINALPKSRLCKQLADTLSIPYAYPTHTYAIQAKAKAKEEVKAKEATAKTETLFFDFGEFWKLYPRKRDKMTAERKYNAVIKKKQATHNMIMAGVRQYIEEIESKGTEDKFIKYPATWLGKGSWENEYDEDDNSTGFDGVNDADVIAHIEEANARLAKQLGPEYCAAHDAKLLELARQTKERRAERERRKAEEYQRDD